ncbi:unnamed protein product, partial [Mesorhabditis belari]|uniref:Uncharacterized protein n=1 Tax=Mesorhabditis belari TaxID=2138241 RepID=A0AAF3J1L3_9BILA
MAKVEVQIRHCFCCGLSVATILIALYSLFLYSLLSGLGAWGLSDTINNGDVSHYNSCEQEAEGKINADNRKVTFHPSGQTTVVIEDTTSYHCSFGLYTEELKYSREPRELWLMVDVTLWVLLILASVLLIVGIVIYNHWLLAPWMLLMAIDIIRGFISTFMIFWLSHSNLARIATGIFFLGLQILHTSLLMLIVAKFQKIFNRRNGIIIDNRPPYQDPRGYPTMASNYAYSPDVRRDGGGGGGGGGGYYPDPRADPYYGQPPPPHGAYDNHGYPRY